MNATTTTKTLMTQLSSHLSLFAMNLDAKMALREAGQDETVADFALSLTAKQVETVAAQIDRTVGQYALTEEILLCVAELHETPARTIRMVANAASLWS